MAACGDGFWEIDPTDGSAWFSAWFGSRLAWSGGEHRATFATLRPSMTPAAWRELLDAMRAHLETGAPLDIEIPVQPPSGETWWWSFRGRAERDARRQPIHLSGSVRDVTSERGLAESCRAEIARWRNAYAALPLALALLDADGAIVAVSDRWRERIRTGYPALVGRETGTSFAEIASAVGGAQHFDRRPIGDDHTAYQVLWRTPSPETGSPEEN